MWFIRYILAMLCTLGFLVTASPVGEAVQERGAPSQASVELYREASGAGHIVYYGTASNDIDEGRIEKRWGHKCDASTEPTLQCDTKHGARNEDCLDLVSDLQTNAYSPVVSGAHQLCYFGPSAKNFVCCIMWSNHNIGGLVKGDLIPHAQWSKASIPRSYKSN